MSSKKMQVEQPPSITTNNNSPPKCSNNLQNTQSKDKNSPSTNYNSISKYPSTTSTKKMSRSKILVTQQSMFNSTSKTILKLTRTASKIPRENFIVTTTRPSSNPARKLPSSSVSYLSSREVLHSKLRSVANHL